MIGPKEEEVIRTFIEGLDAHWIATRGMRTGRLFPDAAIIAKGDLSRWLHESKPLKEGTPPSPDGFGGWLKSPEWLVVCDASNNPPESQAANRLHVRVMAVMFRQIVSHDLMD